MSLRLIAPGKRKGNRHWYARGRLGGKLYEFSTNCADKADAERVAAAFAARVLTEPAQTIRPRTFKDAADAYLAFRKPAKEHADRLTKLTAKIGDQMVSAIRQQDLVAAADALYPGAKASTLNRNVITPASAVLIYASEQGWCERRTWRRYKEPRPVARAIDAKAARKLVSKAKGDARLLLLLLFGTGQRISDVLRLTWADVDLRTGTLKMHVRKTDTHRTLPLAAGLVDALREREGREGPLLPYRNRWAAYKALEDAVKAAGVAFTPHMARHTLGTLLAQSGASLRTIMDALGHADAKSSLRYQAGDVEVVRAAAAPIVGRIVGKRAKRREMA